MNKDKSHTLQTLYILLSNLYKQYNKNDRQSFQHIILSIKKIESIINTINNR